MKNLQKLKLWLKNNSIIEKKYTIIDEHNDIIGRVTFKQLQELARELNKQLWEDTPCFEDRIALESKDLTNIDDIKDTLESAQFYVKRF